MDDEEWDLSGMEEVFGSSMMVTYGAEIILTIDSAVPSLGIMATMSIAFSGGNIATAWEFLKENFVDDDDDDLTVTVNDATYTITMIQIIPTMVIDESYIEGMLEQGYKINQYGTKIIAPVGEGNPVPIIMVKQ